MHASLIRGPCQHAHRSAMFIPLVLWPTAGVCSILVANNGLAAVKLISYLRRWANNTFGHDRMVRPWGLYGHSI